ncbi:hypothetical protein PF005_g16946 [Phytophthora fragariae]|uniref:RxLR effector protein n=2 Tax=Phytophthora TaxID=4783 RepID=A0A6A4CHQ4_9STRA|nr:hypothetical protein PF003_g17753 [Phytophthora fragariae]KAE9016267.1 hypothetical protein PR002_g13706 [Phytophthora rubi]KAE8931756.1 hypothetical protein PF009_g18193 [Phytophthora fragariae]KAE9026268.1 hypothetical protein PF011_g2630 [Phytophthora fragariae]KAE9051574.1 hypothetical protein PR001_g1298 [Phytophthora rubi]
MCRYSSRVLSQVLLFQLCTCTDAIRHDFPPVRTTSESPRLITTCTVPWPTGVAAKFF